MIILKESRKELEFASKELEAIIRSTSLVDFELHWKNFLQKIENVWVKSERECQGVKNTFQPWQGQYTRLRRNDPLLSYLKNARDADNHSIQELINNTVKGLTISPAIPGNHPITGLTIINNKVVNYKGSVPLLVQSETRIECVSIRNNGVIYPLPTYHRGQLIKDNHNPVNLAKLGLSFYKQYLSDIEDKFNCH